MAHSHPDADSKTLDVLRALVRAYQSFTTVAFAHIETMGLGPAEFDVLAALAGTEGLTFRDLSTRTLIYKTTLTSIVDRLERKGLTERKACTEDRRCIYVLLTDEGQAMFDKVFPEHVAYMSGHFDGVDAAEMQRITGELNALAKRFC